MGRDLVTDSAGYFAAPRTHGGAYLVVVDHPGFDERRLSLEVPKGKGRELSFRLSPLHESRTSPGREEALWELGRRLAFGIRRARMMPQELRNFGSMRLCDIPKLRVLAGDPTTVVLNGVTVLREVSLCAWRADEVAILELCSQGSCTNPDAPSPLRYPDPSGRQRPGGAIVLWERQ
jgi:hypothetical protein